MKERLEILCDRVKEWRLPLNIEEIWGFGSFFRLKDRPGDVDLILKYSHSNPDYDTFEQILDRTIPRRSDGDPLKEAFLKIAAIELTEDEFEELSPIFTKWIKGYTWNVIFSGLARIPALKINKIEITKRVLLRDLAGIHIYKIVSDDESLDRLLAVSISRIWSTDSTDAPANLEAILSPEKVRLARVKELENFDSELSGYKTEHEIVLALVKHVRELEDTKIGDDYKNVLQKKARASFPTIPEKTLEGIINNIDRDNSGVPITPPSAKLFEYTNSKDREIKDLVEIRRSELKDMLGTLAVVKKILLCLCIRKHETPKKWAGLYSLDEVVAQDVISAIPKKEVSEKKIKEILGMLNFPEGLTVK